MRRFFSALFLLAVIASAAHAGQAARPRVLDIEIEETRRVYFEDMEFRFAPERVYYDRLGNLVVDGAITNAGAFECDRVAIDCIGRDKDGKVVATTRNYTFPMRLRPAQQGSVRMVFPLQQKRYIHSIEYTLTARKPEEGVEVVRRTVEQAERKAAEALPPGILSTIRR